MHCYALILEKMLQDLDDLSKYIDESYDHVMSLEPKSYNNRLKDRLQFKVESVAGVLYLVA